MSQCREPLPLRDSRAARDLLHARTYLERYDFSGLDLGEVDISGRHFSHCRFAGTDMRACHAKTGCFTGCDLHGARLTEAEFDDCLLEDCFLEEADLSRATLTRVTLERVSLRRARLEQAIIAETLFRAVHWEEANFARAMFRTLSGIPDFVDSDLSMLLFTDCDLDGIAFVRARGLLVNLQDCRAADMSATDCNFPQFIAMNGLYSKARFTACRLGSAAFTRSDMSGSCLTECDLTGAHLDGCLFSRSTVKDTLLPTASLEGADFSEALLDNVDMSMSNLAHALFNGTQLLNVNMRLADLHGVNLARALSRDLVLEQVRYTDGDRLLAESFSVR